MAWQLRSFSFSPSVYCISLLYLAENISKNIKTDLLWKLGNFYFSLRMDLDIEKLQHDSI